MTFKKVLIYILYIQIFIIVCYGDTNINIYVDCNSEISYENYECGGYQAGNGNKPPCKSLYDASQAALKFRNGNELVLYMLPGVYIETKQLSFTGYKIIGITRHNENSTVIIDGSQMDDKLSSSFIYMDDNSNEQIGISRITFRNWGINSNIISLEDGNKHSKEISFSFCDFENTSVILNCDSWSKKTFRFTNSNFINLNTSELERPILKMRNAVLFLMVVVNVTNCTLNKQVPFMDIFASRLNLNTFNFNGNEMGSFLTLKSDLSNVFTGTNLQFINNNIMLYPDIEVNQITNVTYKYSGFIKLIAPLYSKSNSLNGFIFQNNTIGSIGDNINSMSSIFQIKRTSFDLFSNINLSNNTIMDIHFLYGSLTEIKKIETSTILMEFLIIGNNFVSSIQNTKLNYDFNINCPNCNITYSSISTNTPEPTVTPTPSTVIPTPFEKQESSNVQFIIIIALSIFSTSIIVLFIFIFIWKRKFKHYENKNYISLDILEAKPSFENDEELLDNEGASCDNDDVDQSTPNIYYKQDTDDGYNNNNNNNDNNNYEDYYIFNQQRQQQILQQQLLQLKEQTQYDDKILFFKKEWNEN